VSKLACAIAKCKVLVSVLCSYTRDVGPCDGFAHHLRRTYYNTQFDIGNTCVDHFSANRISTSVSIKQTTTAAAELLFIANLGCNSY
jgi:hypothetical protein